MALSVLSGGFHGSFPKNKPKGRLTFRSKAVSQGHPEH